MLEAYSLRDRLEIEEIEVAVSEVLLLADRENLKAYDASYLWLSRNLGVELVTLDRDLNAVLARDQAEKQPAK